MCLIESDDLDGWQLLRDVMRTARKEHKCDECGRTIEPGETYRYACGVSYEDWCSDKCCTHCQMAQKWLMRQCRGYLFRSVLIDLEGHLGEPIERGYRARLCRLVVGMRRQWQRFDGEGTHAGSSGERMGESTVKPPEPMVWHGLCNYVTDNWMTLSRTTGGIPCCPHCGRPGYEAPAASFWAGAKKYDSTHPGYLQVLRDNLERCGADYGALWKASQS